MHKHDKSSVGSWDMKERKSPLSILGASHTECEPSGPPCTPNGEMSEPDRQVCLHPMVPGRTGKLASIRQTERRAGCKLQINPGLNHRAVFGNRHARHRQRGG